MIDNNSRSRMTAMIGEDPDRLLDDFCFNHPFTVISDVKLIGSSSLVHLVGLTSLLTLAVPLTRPPRQPEREHSVLRHDKNDALCVSP